MTQVENSRSADSQIPAQPSSAVTMPSPKMSRRHFLKILGIGTVTLTACNLGSRVGMEEVPLSTNTPESLGDGMGQKGPVSVAQNPTPETKAVIVTEEEAIYDPDSVTEGEFEDNADLLTHQAASALTAEVTRRMIEGYVALTAAEAAGNQEAVVTIKRRNSTLSSHVNEPPKPGFGKDPVTEPGFGHTAGDMGKYRYLDYYFGIEAESTPSGERKYRRSEKLLVKDLGHVNEHGHYTIAVFGLAHDADAAAAVAAAAVLYRQNPSLFVDELGRDITLNDAIKSPRLREAMSAKQLEIRMTGVDKLAGLSQAEASRRGDPYANLQDFSIAAAPLNIEDQYNSCDVYRPNASTRREQLQALREVKHRAGGATTFTETDSEIEVLECIVTIPEGEQAEIAGWFTYRGYFDRDGKDEMQIFATVGEEEFPCGNAAPEKQNVAPRQPQQPQTQPTSQPYSPPVSTEVPPQPTQPPQPTIPPQPTVGEKSPPGNQSNPNGEQSGDRGQGQTGGDAGGTH